jgi:EAL domain-containing protein (putative c-di-GMP-specific phosphodiesterase class I)
VVDVAGGIGIACGPEHAATAEALLSRAEVAMYEAKHRRAGKLVYDPAFDHGSAATLTLLGEMRRALQQHELRLFIQPKLHLLDDTLVGAEALVRWQHPQRGLVPPLEFIPFAEETGFIHELSLWVVDEAARLLAHWQAGGLLPRLSVNLSVHDLMKADLVERLQWRLQRHGVPPASLCLEITESAIMNDPERALQTLQALKALGCRLSIDDFGTGYSSYATLRDLPVDELKIDMSFVRAMEKVPKDAMIVRSIIDVAHNLDLSVVAEGVENEAIRQQLALLGCDEAQGWHIGRPMPAEQFEAWAMARGAQAGAAACRPHAADLAADQAV